MGHVLYQISEMHFRLLGTNRFDVKANKERFTATRGIVSKTSSTVKTRIKEQVD